MSTEIQISQTRSRHQRLWFLPKENENNPFVLNVTLLTKSSSNTMSRTALTNLYRTAVSSFYPNYLLKNSPQELEKYPIMKKTSKATATLCLWDTEFNYNSQEQWYFFRFPRELPLGEFHFPLYICLKDLKLFWWTILWGSNIRRFKEIPSNWKQIIHL